MSVLKTIRIFKAEMELCFIEKLLAFDFSSEDAKKCANIFTQNSLDGVYSHGVNRFPRFIDFLKKGYVIPKNKPLLKNKLGVIEQWDGASGPGPSNAFFATNKALDLANKYGIGCIALSNTNHWMRGGYYAWQAAKKGYIFIGWSNTAAIMPAWGAKNAKLGNNPLVIGIPYRDEAVVLDMSMSQFSYGAMELTEQKNEKLPVTGGYDKDGNLTNDPSLILESLRTLPIGFWKGSGLSFVLDVLAAILSDGLAVHQVAQKEDEISCSQIFITIDPKKLTGYNEKDNVIDEIVKDLKSSAKKNHDSKISYPGERAVNIRKENSEKGIPVSESVWNEIVNL
ncbi:3-dehydro-L-gulonate 2-dehydrogenase [Flavobacteriaceae bacterium]|nr:3-dehydro-L-gulonate 2-dehydrogenase [Flavobacteriaceae bacterium]